MYCPNCGKEINSDYNFCKHCGYELRSFNNKQKDSCLDLEIEYNKLDDYIKKEVEAIVDKLLVSNLGNFIKQWINFAVLVIFHNFKVVCELKDDNKLNVKDYIELVRVPTLRSLNIYLKIFLIHFLIVFPNNEDNKKTLIINKLSFDELKQSVFDFFDFDDKLKIIYEKGYNYYQNEIKYSDYMLKNYIMHSFNEKIEEVNFITSTMFRMSLSNAYAGLIDYFNAV